MDQLKQYIKEASGFLKRDLGICNKEGQVLASGDPELETRSFPEAAKALADGADFYFDGSFGFRPVNPEKLREGLVFMAGDNKEDLEDLLTLLVSWMRAKSRERDTALESQTFLKNVLLENELPGDIPLKAREYEIAYSQCRQAMLLHFDEPAEPFASEKIAPLLAEEGEDYLLPVDECNVVILLAVEPDDETRTAQMAETLMERFEAAGCPLRFGIGQPALTLKDTAKSYREASLALIVGGIFEEDQKIMWYTRLGLGRLIYQLPPTLCEMFLQEVFREGAYEQLDDETLLTVDKFFENNLNGSETSRQLFVHRNTLVYRLDKVKKITGLDLRVFEEAVQFKLASMVYQYLEYIHPEEKRP